jgi:hypothetical protein
MPMSDAPGIDPGIPAVRLGAAWLAVGVATVGADIFMLATAGPRGAGGAEADLVELAFAGVFGCAVADELGAVAWVSAAETAPAAGLAVGEMLAAGGIAADAGAGAAETGWFDAARFSSGRAFFSQR